MKFWHRGTVQPEVKPLLDKWGVSHQASFGLREPHRVSYYVVELDESHPGWPELSRYLKTVFFWTEFSRAEVLQAEWAMAHATHSIRDLRPGDYAWSTEFFANRCENCGSGWRQTSAFRIKKEASLGENVFSGFGSGFELFCAPVVLEAFKQHGIRGYDTWPLVLEKEDRPTQSLRQLIVRKIAQPAIAVESVDHERYRSTDCSVCGRTWHVHYTRGMLPLRAAALNQDLDFQLTNEWFGNGRTARREILCSRRVINLALERNWYGIEFEPVKIV